MADAAPLRVLLVDDEPLATERLSILCARIAGLRLVGAAADGEAALRMADALSPDVVLLDIAMPGMTGVDVARALDRGAVARPPAVIFVTAFDDFAVDAFDLAAVDYLLKPVAEDRLRRAFDRARDRLVVTAAPERSPWLSEIWVPHRAEIIRLDVADIELIEAERDYMRLHAGGRSFLLHRTLAELERRLDPERFVRVHRSAIVRRDRIAGLRHDGGGSWEVALTDGRAMRVGRTFLPVVRALARG